MLYQEGEKLKVLKETIKSVPQLAELDESNFILSGDDYTQFTSPITAVYNHLSNALFNTLLNTDSKAVKRAKKDEAIDAVINYLNEHYKTDLIDNFYEEKIKFYDYMFAILMSEELSKHFPNYKNDFETIRSIYLDLKEKKEIFDFRKVKELIMDYKSVDAQLGFITYSRAAIYLIHGKEMILEEISNIIKRECKTMYKKPDILPNRLRQLIYLVKAELELDLGTEDEQSE